MSKKEIQALNLDTLSENMEGIKHFLVYADEISTTSKCMNTKVGLFL